MDYFTYASKGKLRESAYNSLPKTPTLLVHESEKTACRPTSFLKYSLSFFRSRNSASTIILNSLSTSLPSPPITPQVPLILPSLSLPSSSEFKKCLNKTTQTPKFRVLLVDDNSVNLQILSRLLTTHMSDVFKQIEIVKSGVKALEVLKCRPFDLVLMDIDMPILNGVETTRHIRSTTESDILLHNRSILIVAVTTNDSDEWRQLYTKVGMNGCISKPISLNELKSTLSNLLELDLSQSSYTPE
ncbi:hypothetical protein G6F55_004237 [Rhizopus delemar]|nr:hypothetical protein G6F55_004237 [Rhizopus delemar]KAG1633053.1 hypothetical protein G6F45_003697 [Rhizopus arrhizus]KAG1498607.1 hypothetical protein G6F54_004963 [Rhizopus delemar]KAG1514407.1 hypothetical protein G6F53_003703 [Rhizopus delemar]KAG1588212.1 hypothetical protein G6F48_005429 [Rhizopus delemar]